MATRRMEGSASLRMASRFGANSPARSEIPVILPPGRRRLSISPSETRSPAPEAMAGTGAPLHAAMAGNPDVRIASTPTAIRSLTSDGKRSMRQLANVPTTEVARLFDHPTGLAVSNARVALPNFYNIAIRIANVAARLAVLGLRLRDELGSSTSP